MTSLLKHLRFFKHPLLVYRTAKGLFYGAVLKKDVLRSVEFAVTYRCNFSCEKCYARGLSDSKKKEMTVAQIKEMWEQAYKLGAIHINLTGGEPMVREDIYDIVKVCKPKSTIVSLVTNASLLNEEKVEKLAKAGLNSLQISLDSADLEEHDSLRRKGNYNQIMKTIEWCKKYGITVCLSTVIHRNNVPDMIKLIHLCERLDVFLLFNMASIEGGWKDKRNVLLTEEQVELVDLMRKSYSIVRQDLSFNFRGKGGCPAGIEKLYITAYGDVVACVFMQEHWGNIFEEQLKTIWEKARKDPEFRRKNSRCLRYDPTADKHFCKKVN